MQGTTSDDGKSTLVAGQCRVLCRRGLKVVPFKPQNMALNSAVTVDGGEIDRAQAVQAEGCGLTSHTDMNPGLLKPNSDRGCQVIIHGKVVGNQEACAYHDYKKNSVWCGNGLTAAPLKLICGTVILPIWALLMQPIAR